MGSDDLFKKRKAARKVADYKRKTGKKGEDRDLILIVCEGTKSEPNYFHGFKLTNLTIEGCGGDPLTVVDKAISIQTSEKAKGKIFDQVWCVFDRDSFPAYRFNGALQKAEARDFKVAYSNEAFELWYVLHFEYLNTGISRNDYGDKISHYIQEDYQKNDPYIFDKLQQFGDQNLAIRYAARLVNSYNPRDPYNDNPSTTVYTLVEILNKWYK
ncbi:RloB family protein [Mesobacillus thioparans]|uniref:RloB family protein n=1 Tax=Mesobacillus thioparans TaxID=370439 RepID=UPI0039EE7310